MTLLIKRVQYRAHRRITRRIRQRLQHLANTLLPKRTHRLKNLPLATTKIQRRFLTHDYSFTIPADGAIDTSYVLTI